MRISDWSSDVCSSDLPHPVFGREEVVPALAMATQSQTVPLAVLRMHLLDPPAPALDVFVGRNGEDAAQMFGPIDGAPAHVPVPERSEEHTSELQSLMRISYAVFCLKNKKTNNTTILMKDNK